MIALPKSFLTGNREAFFGHFLPYFTHTHTHRQGFTLLSSFDLNCYLSAEVPRLDDTTANFYCHFSQLRMYPWILVKFIESKPKYETRFAKPSQRWSPQNLIAHGETKAEEK
ncbi:hypothetical protein ACN38_g1246 [Penicillium nordicum]|uniref:Uncharacterized protein n=1 Tax=Penicillium nordicum TaxID=229535 RepID=A0A0M8PGM2_9EURO|nr:hypothetical protein ACN38_g1246 [Penicillium nordicum]